jgi:hypothetical protein
VHLEASTKPHVHQKFEIFWTSIAFTMGCPNSKNRPKKGLHPLGVNTNHQVTQVCGCYNFHTPNTNLWEYNTLQWDPILDLHFFEIFLVWFHKHGTTTLISHNTALNNCSKTNFKWKCFLFLSNLYPSCSCVYKIQEGLDGSRTSTNANPDTCSKLVFFVSLIALSKVATSIPVWDPYPHLIKIPILVIMTSKYKEHGSCSQHIRNTAIGGKATYVIRITY